MSLHPLRPRHTAYAQGVGEGGGWCDDAGKVTTTDETANIAVEAVNVFRLRAGQELLRLFLEGQGNTHLPCLAVGPGLKMEAFFSNEDWSSQTWGCDVGSLHPWEAV